MYASTIWLRMTKFSTVSQLRDGKEKGLTAHYKDRAPVGLLYCDCSVIVKGMRSN